MKRVLVKSLLTAAMFLYTIPAEADPVAYTLDPTHTSITWFANHFGFSNPSGKFAKVQGTLELDEAKPEKSKLEVTVAMGSVLTGVDKLDAHLRTDAFFDVEKFPSAYFSSKKIEMMSKNTAKVEGDLSLRGITKPVTLLVTLNKIGESPITHNKTAGFSATTTILRSQFGIDYALPGVADEVKLIIESEAVAGGQ